MSVAETDQELADQGHLLRSQRRVFTFSEWLKGKSKVGVGWGLTSPWRSSSVGWRVFLMRQGCRFDPQSGHMQESTNECIDKWNNKSMPLPPHFPLSLQGVLWHMNSAVGRCNTSHTAGRAENVRRVLIPAVNTDGKQGAKHLANPGLLLSGRRQAALVGRDPDAPPQPAQHSCSSQVS